MGSVTQRKTEGKEKINLDFFLALSYMLTDTSRMTTSVCPAVVIISVGLSVKQIAEVTLCGRTTLLAFRKKKGNQHNMRGQECGEETL